MKKVLIALAAILILGAGAAGVYFYFQHPAEASVGDTEEHQAAKEADAHASAEGEQDGGGGDFVELDPLILPIIDETGVAQVVSIVIVIEVSSASIGNDVKKYSPRLKDAYIQEMYGILNEHAALRGGVIQVSMLKDRLKTISRRVLGEDKVVDVLLQVVQQRPI